MSVGEFWPEKGVVTNSWTLNGRDSAPASLSGNSVPVEMGEPFWTIEVEVAVDKRSALAQQWRGFFARRRGKRITFTANRSFHSFPATRATQRPGARVIAHSREAGSIDIVNSRLDEITPGDMVGYLTELGGYYIGEVEGVALENPTVISIVKTFVFPPPFAPKTEPEALRLYKPVGEFRLDAPAQPLETSSRLSWNFTATQIIRG